jgi:hypothetical protein
MTRIEDRSSVPSDDSQRKTNMSPNALGGFEREVRGERGDFAMRRDAVHINVW